MSQWMGTAGISLPFADFILCFCAALINLGSFITFAWRKKKCCLPEMFSWFSSWWYCIWNWQCAKCSSKHIFWRTGTFPQQLSVPEDKVMCLKAAFESRNVLSTAFSKSQVWSVKLFFSPSQHGQAVFAQEEVSGLQVESILSTLESLAFISDNNWLC